MTSSSLLRLRWFSSIPVVMKPRALPSFMDYRPKPLLKRPVHVPEKARFPVIDAHNHLFADMPAEQMVAVMDAVGVKVFMNLTGNCALPFDESGYTIRRRDFDVYRKTVDGASPGEVRRLHHGGVRALGRLHHRS